MSIITREQAKDLRNAFECWQQDYDPVEDKEQYDMFGLGMVAIDALLASLEAEPVAYIFKHPAGRLFWSLTDESNKGQSDVMPVYTAQPAPVVPDEAISLAVDGIMSTYAENHDECRKRIRNHIEDACRAAMLQGAEPVATANKLPFEQWLSQQTGTIDVECGCVMTEVFFHWLRVAYEAGNSPVIPDGWVILPAEPTQTMMNAWLSEVANWRGHAAGYRAMIAAAPQQEVKP